MTNERKEIFLAELGRTGVFAHAARAASPNSKHGALNSFRAERERDPEFAAAWDEAIEVSTGIIEQEAIRRAVEGWDDGKVRKYSDRLMELILKRRDAAYHEHRKYEVDARTEVTDKKKDLRVTIESLSSEERNRLEHALLQSQVLLEGEDSLSVNDRQKWREHCSNLGPDHTNDATPTTTEPSDDRAKGSLTDDLQDDD